MGLAERKAIAAVKEGEYKTVEQEIHALCGSNVKVNMDWSAIENHSECVSIVSNKRYNSMLFERVITALKNIASDDMGKTALKEGLKEIHMVPLAGPTEFVGGVLTVRNDLTGQGAWRTEQIQDVLEKGL